MTDIEINHKITQALERISKTFRVLLWQESKKYGISPIQIQILIFCLTHEQEMLKVSFFAKEFDLTKATISDSVKVLLEKKMLIKIPDTYDSRSYMVELTKEGKEIANKVSGYTNALDHAIGKLTDTTKGIFLNGLLKIIENLNRNSIISIQRMCLTCYHYSKNGNEHYCSFLEKSLNNHELQIDCPDHQALVE
ncbi:MarR family winged helix-turn-helix transcriptional regulator [Aquimarina algiphila]|uniref:MarR family winged helix-turn-helix transcriptional regulator n=1 Tax=Aquimarina algiphila TaxID=2047982 RepID=UPI00232D9999|nr:MarR family transcriptional regulator [Aquimarina algiphila]